MNRYHLAHAHDDGDRHANGDDTFVEGVMDAEAARFGRRATACISRAQRWPTKRHTYLTRRWWTTVAAGLTPAFGLGSRDVTRNAFGWLPRPRPVRLGDGLIVDGEVGTLEDIGSTNAQTDTGEDVLVVPNSRLTEGTVPVGESVSSEKESTNRYESASHPES